MKNIFLATILAASSAMASDCKLLKGAAISSKALSVDIRGVGNSEYHMRTFIILRNGGNHLSWLVKSELIKELSNENYKKSLLRIATGLDNSAQGGRGDVYYWIQMSEAKIRDLENAAGSLEDLAAIACSSKPSSV